jgi:hypothetical protein
VFILKGTVQSEIDGRDRMASSDRFSLTARGGAARVRGGEFAGDEGHGCFAVLGRRGWVKKVRGSARNTKAGIKSGQGHRRVAAHSEAARRRRHLSPVRNRARQREREGKGEGTGGLLPQGEPQVPLDDRRGAMAARAAADDTGAARRRAGERGQGKSKRDMID